MVPDTSITLSYLLLTIINLIVMYHFTTSFGYIVTNEYMISDMISEMISDVISDRSMDEERQNERWKTWKICDKSNIGKREGKEKC